jgi:glycosyltransferase involved in cell wall biosynthesis
MNRDTAPLVSVVIPTFGRPQLLARAIRSVLGQTLHALEVVVVVDGPDPATLDGLAQFSDPRLRVLSHAAKRGPGKSRATGVAASSADWIAFLDDDDEWLPAKLEKQLAAVPSVPAILMTVSRVVTPTAVLQRPDPPYDNVMPIDEWLFDSRGGFVQSSSLMVPRALFGQLDFRATHEDWEFVVRAVKQLGYRLVTVPEPLVIHYLGQARPSASKAFGWRQSLSWVQDLGHLITPRAYSGFCLIVIPRAEVGAGRYFACLPLLWTAFRRGRPTTRQLLACLLIWALPEGFRRRARAILSGRGLQAQAGSR